MPDRPDYLVSLPLPKLLHSHETGAPLEHCIECSRSILDSDTDYLIEKAFRSYQGFGVSDTIFEYALCMECCNGLFSQVSTESARRLDDYFKANMNYAERMGWLREMPPDFGKWLSCCAIKGTPVTELAEYQIVAHCHGDQLILSVFPYLIGGEAMDELCELLSNKTIDLLDDFSGRHFAPPPEFTDTRPRRILPVL